MTNDRKNETDQNAEESIDNLEEGSVPPEQKSDKTVGKGPTSSTNFANINDTNT